MDSLKDEAFEYADEMVLKLRDFYAAEKADLSESLPKLLGGMISKPIFSQMGKASGVSRQLKALEGDLIASGIDQATGMPGAGAVIAKLAKKHPIIMQLAPMFMNARAKGHPNAVRTINQGNGVGYG